MNIQADNRTFIERITENQNFVFFTFAVILFPLMLHTSQLLLLVSSISGKWYAYSFALGFDLAILHFAVNGRMAQAGAMAIVIFIINVSFYNSALMFSSFDPGIVKLIITIVISGTSAWIVHTYVVLFIAKKQTRNQVQELLEKNYTKEKQIARLERTVAEHAKIGEQIVESAKVVDQKMLEIESLKEIINSLKPEALPGNKIKCDTCKNEFNGQKSYLAFKKVCQICPEVHLEKGPRIEKQIVELVN